MTQPVELPAGWDPAGLGLPPEFGWHAAGGPVRPRGMPAPARGARGARRARADAREEVGGVAGRGRLGRHGGVRGPGYG